MNLDEARAALARHESQNVPFYSPLTNHLYVALEWALDELAKAEAERDEALKEMHARELHHFEEEKLRADAEAERDRLQAAIEDALGRAHECYRSDMTCVDARILSAALTPMEQQ